MRHRIKIDGKERVISIRAMDERFVVYRKMFAPPLTPENIRRVNPGDPSYLKQQLEDGRFEIIETFFRKQIRLIGSCMILAWDGNGVIGKMHFTNREVHEALGGPEKWDSPSCYCVDHPGFAPAIQKLGEEELSHLLNSPSRVLRILCFNVGHSEQRYQGQGIAKAMVEYLKQWARKRGWRRIEARSCPDITPPTVVGDWMLRRGPLERLGFHVAEICVAPPREVEKRRRAISELAANKGDAPDRPDWFVRNFERLYAAPTYRSEYDKDYIMACDLLSRKQK